MKTIPKRIITFLLFVAMSVNCFSVLPVFAQEEQPEIESSSEVQESNNLSDDNTIQKENSETEDTSEDSTEKEPEYQNQTLIEQESDDVEKEETTVQLLPGDTSLVNYFYVGTPYLQAPATQQFVLSLGKGTESIESVKLQYQNESGTIFELESNRNSDELFVFSKEFTTAEQGTYSVTGFEYVIGNQTYKINFSELEMDIRFGVNQAYDGYGQNEGLVLDSNGNEVHDQENVESQSDLESVQSSIVSLDGSNSANAQNLVESAIKNNVNTSNNRRRKARSASKYSPGNPLVICIDPGHGGTESGTIILDGSYEKNMNLKIAMYLKEELEQYNNVKVVMTRTTDTNVSLLKRAQIAADAGATALVSIHINATGLGTQNRISGAEVYYPHANYDETVSVTGKNLAQNILNELVGLGLNNLGIKVKYVYDPQTGDPVNDSRYDYPDGSVGDYYGVIRHSKELGVAGIIVEHAMSDNWSDYNRFLSSDAKLKNLGIADATGIAKAFRLKKIDRSAIDQFALQNKNTVQDGTYMIKNISNSEVISVKDSSTDDGASINLQENASSDYQGWRIFNNDNGYVSIMNVYSGKFLTVSNQSYITQSDANDYRSLWIIKKENTGYKIYSAMDTRYVLDFSQKNLIITDESETNKQLWLFEKYNQKRASVLYKSHVQGIGWQQWVQNGSLSGTTNQSKRIEAVNIQLSDNISGSIEYQAHVQREGWQSWVSDGDLSGTIGKSLQMEAIRIRLKGEAASKYDVYYRTHVKDLGWLGWAKNGNSSGTVGYGYRIEGIQVQLVAKGKPAPGSTSNTFKEPMMSYQTHVQNLGWQSSKSDGETSGTSGQSRRLESIKISLSDSSSGGVQYSTHVQGIGWQDWVSDGALSGTTGQSKRLEAIKIKLTGKIADQYDVYYRVHAQQFGWLGWAKNGESAGTAGYSYRLEAIQIKLVSKGQNAPGSTADAFKQRFVQYQTHVQRLGWQEVQYDGDTSGTTGQSLRLESIKISLPSLASEGGIDYKTHIQGIGWQDWVSDGALSGTTGQSKRLEAIKIKLTGKIADQYDVYYRVHAQQFGWLGWAKNGESAGTAGYSYRLEGIQIQFVPKGSSAPGSTSHCFYDKNEIETEGYAIMGASNISSHNLIDYYNKYKGKNTYYDQYSNENVKYNGVLAKGGAATIEQFCQIFYEECVMEGVKPEVAFAQSMLETNFLQFTGDVHPDQYNFAGLGATGGGNKGNSFKNVRIGIRAQVQHLKCYASKDLLKQAKVDPRWSDSLREKAITVEQLQGTWATSPYYAESLLRGINRIISV